jgi:hypothetical protein
MAAPALVGLANIGTLLGGAGAAAGGIGSLIGAFGGGRTQQPSLEDQASLYAQLAAGQVPLTMQQYRYGAMLQPWLQAEGAETQIAGQSAYDQFKNALQKDQTAAGQLAGIASQYASSAIGLQDLAGKGRLAAETLGIETAGNMAKNYATAASNLATGTLSGEAGLLNPTGASLAAAGQTAQQGKNLLATNIGSTNLGIRQQQEQTRNELVKQRAATEGQLALKRYGAGLALAGQAAFA